VAAKVVCPGRLLTYGSLMALGVVFRRSAIEAIADMSRKSPRHAPHTGRSHSFAGQLAGLLHPSGELSFVELVVLMDVEVARVLALGLAGGTGRSDVPRKKATLTYFVKQWMPRNQPWHRRKEAEPDFNWGAHTYA
jgi:hypothetical protein